MRDCSLFNMALIRLQGWERQGSWEDTFHTVTVELASTGSILVVEVSLVACITWESTWTNSKCFLDTRGSKESPSSPSVSQCLTYSVLVYSHPGYFGKQGMRVFRLQRNQQFQPIVNLDKLWSLVSEQTRLKAQASKDKAAVIDVTKAVNYYLYIINYSNRAISRSSARALSPRSPSSSRPSSSPRLLRRESRRLVVLASSSLEQFMILATPPAMEMQRMYPWELDEVESLFSSLLNPSLSI